MIDRAAEMDGPYVAVVGQAGGGEGGRVGATNIGRLRQGKAARGGVNVSSWHLRVFAAVVGVMGCLLLAASLVMSALHQVQFRNGAISVNFRGLQELKQNFVRKEQSEQIMHERLLQMATLATSKCRTSQIVEISHYGRNPTNRRANGRPVPPNTPWKKSLARTTMASF